MNYLASFTEKDVFPDNTDMNIPTTLKERVTGKSIILDSDGNIALVGNLVNDFYLLPGGGVEDGESIEDGVVRECLEEVGCNVTLGDLIGIIEDFRLRDSKHCITHCYCSKVIGDKTTQQLTSEEEKNGMHVKWISPEDALIIFEKQKVQLENGEVTFYNTGFNILRDLAFLKEFINKEKHEKDFCFKRL
jgi:ADP-ribose pyrophosphatase YjhB (NUDIX family)